MGERKVLNKYYPPDFDPAKIPKLSLPKDRQYVVRLMAPFSMRCTTCGEYIYKGKKFNARKETAWNEEYLGIRIYRFYIRCTRCISEITFKTDPKNTDYVCENGAVRNFQAERLALMAAEAERDLLESEESENPMLALERRTKESKQEIDILDALEGIKDRNSRLKQVSVQNILDGFAVTEEDKGTASIDDREDEELVSEYLGALKTARVKRVEDTNSDEECVELNPDLERKRKNEKDDEIIENKKKVPETIFQKPVTQKAKLKSFVSVKLAPKPQQPAKELKDVKVKKAESNGLLKLGEYSSDSGDDTN